MKIINLLPKPRQQTLRDESVLHSLLKVITISVVSFVIVIGAQLAVKVYLQATAAGIRTDVERLRQQVSKQENAKVKSEVEAVNAVITNYRDVALVSPKWSKVVKAFAVLPPEEVTVSSFVIDFTKKSITINGISPTRELVIELYNNILNDSKEFYNIDYPLENVATPKDISYHFTFYIHEDLLK